MGDRVSTIESPTALLSDESYVTPICSLQCLSIFCTLSHCSVNCWPVPQKTKCMPRRMSSGIRSGTPYRYH